MTKENEVVRAEDVVQAGIRPSKKYANGTIHENASGRFQILDRFLGKDGIIYMKIQWLSTGQLETNKEVNISASIWKFEKAHGKLKPVEEKEPLPAITPADTYEKLCELEEFLKQEHEDRKTYQEHFLELLNNFQKQDIIIKEMLTKLDRAFTEIHELNKKHDLASKLVDKI